mmetsp:Transcript_10761/g.18833  ORF Transcript_10761/g.18833 Transcript_10761/m.18833 type:complete len:279 (+) Transcript_10761:147-983(+)
MLPQRISSNAFWPIHSQTISARLLRSSTSLETTEPLVYREPTQSAMSAIRKTSSTASESFGSLLREINLIRNARKAGLETDRKKTQCSTYQHGKADAIQSEQGLPIPSVPNSAAKGIVPIRKHVKYICKYVYVQINTRRQKKKFEKKKTKASLPGGPTAPGHHVNRLVRSLGLVLVLECVLHRQVRRRELAGVLHWLSGHGPRGPRVRIAVRPVVVRRGEVVVGVDEGRWVLVALGADGSLVTRGGPGLVEGLGSGDGEEVGAHKSLRGSRRGEVVLL